MMPFAPEQAGAFIKFQSPSGVLGVCRDAKRKSLAAEMARLYGVSVPFRGFRGLQDVAEQKRKGERKHRFQSPSGVLGVCRATTSTVSTVSAAEFQSPSGVLGVCRLTMQQAEEWAATLFQSPSGVLGVCRVTWQRRMSRGPFPSFQSPSGVLGVCRLDEYVQQAEAMTVSVPFRGFRGLQGTRYIAVRGTYQGFQSPSGVLGVCRARRRTVRDSHGSVSVPFRCFRGLQGHLHEGLRCFFGGVFQSPSGVLGVCRSVTASWCPRPVSCFSPLPGF